MTAAIKELARLGLAWFQLAHINRNLVRSGQSYEADALHALADNLRIVHGIDIAVGAFAKYASVGGGPHYQKAGRKPLYPVGELDAWAEDRLGRVKRSSSDVDRG